MTTLGVNSADVDGVNGSDENTMRGHDLRLQCASVFDVSCNETNREIFNVVKDLE